MLQKYLSQKKERKLTEDNPNNQPRATIVLNDLINKRK